jgi:hypothetical protein
MEGDGVAVFLSFFSDFSLVDIAFRHFNLKSIYIYISLSLSHTHTHTQIAVIAGSLQWRGLVFVAIWHIIAPMICLQLVHHVVLPRVHDESTSV